MDVVCEKNFSPFQRYIKIVSVVDGWCCDLSLWGRNRAPASAIIGLPPQVYPLCLKPFTELDSQVAWLNQRKQPKYLWYTIGKCIRKGVAKVHYIKVQEFFFNKLKPNSYFSVIWISNPLSLLLCSVVQSIAKGKNRILPVL